MIPEAHDFDYCYDVETFANVFLIGIQHIKTDLYWEFEISPWKNEAPQIVSMLALMRDSGVRMVGFNNINFDYTVIHYLIELFGVQGFVHAEQLHEKGLSVIYSQDKFANTVAPYLRIIPQLDLFKIHHFDNRAKSTSLKALEFNMRSPTVSDMPFDPNVPLTFDQLEIGKRYNRHDIKETCRFYGHTLPMIRFREELSEKYGKDFTNHNDKKIGKDYFIMRLEEAQPGICYPKRGEIRQTFRSSIALGEVIFPKIAFSHPEFQRVLDYLRATRITNTNGAPELKGVSATVRGFQFNFGLGGIHGSINNRVVRSDDTHVLIDVDVASYYPNIAIKNGVFPEHLSNLFCAIYADLYNQRKTYPKKSAESAMLKLALNGVYGDSNSVFSPFYDPKYTMTVTINGQLFLCMLAEALLWRPSFEIIQINTDGMTFRIPRSERAMFDMICQRWQEYTGFELEFAEYQAMFIRDVNDYVAQNVEGKVKRKGVYQWDTSEPNNIAVSRTWSQDWSALVVPMAAQARMIDNIMPADFIAKHPDPFDFMLRVKVSRSSRLVASSDGTDQPLQNLTRYHIATRGPYLFKIMPPAPRKPDGGDRRMAIDKGWPVRVCNDASDFDWSLLDRSYYVRETEKILDMFR